jgi:membrane protease YdiL (CAAX protease family)
MFPIAPMLIALLIPIIYCIIHKDCILKKVITIFICCFFITLFYPITQLLGNIVGNSFGYLLGKIILFTIIPLITIAYLEKRKIIDALIEIGIRKRKLTKSIIFGLIVFVITLIITIIFSWETKGNNSLIWNSILFFEAFNEEVLFRGVLLLYLWKITDVRVAYVTSILAFILAHPQHFSSLFLISTFTQGLMLAIISNKTENIIGPWISHGLNRVIPNLLRIFLF